MLTSTTFAIDYDDADPAQILAGGFDLILTGTDPMNGPQTPSLTDAEVLQLQAQGVRVMSYVNASVTDHTAYYWDPAWTEDGTDNSPITDAAPDWLRTGYSNVWGYFTNYTDPDWQKIVIDQAVDVIRRGAAGVFLDDCGYYYQGLRTGDIGQAARDMMELVIAVKQAITAINPDAYVMINSEPTIVTEAGVNHPTTLAFLDALDGFLMERMWGLTFDSWQPYIDAALNIIQPHAQLFAVETLGTPFQRYLFLEEMRALGISGATSDDNAYDIPGAPVAPATQGNDDLLGTFRANTIHALGGDDVVDANPGDDTVHGGTGNDRLSGNEGNDIIWGGDGADSLFGDNGADLLNGGAGADRLNGGTGYDYIRYHHATAGVYVRLDTARGYSGEATGDLISQVEGIVGSRYGDLLVGSAQANLIGGVGGNDTIYGLGGNDQLLGGRGANRIYGGAGDDRFIFALADLDAGTALRDTVFDYDRVAGNLDTIRFDGIAASSVTASAVSGGVLLRISGIAGGVAEIFLASTTLAEYQAGVDFV